MKLECGLSEIQDLIYDAPTQRTMVDANYVYVGPVGSVKGATEIDFVVENSGDTFIDLPNSEVEIIFRVKKEIRM